MNLGFATDSNTSAYKIWVVEEDKIYITNRVRFNKHKMPMKQEPLRVMGQGTITEKVFVLRDGPLSSLCTMIRGW